MYYLNVATVLHLDDTVCTVRVGGNYDVFLAL